VTVACLAGPQNPFAARNFKNPKKRNAIKVSEKKKQQLFQRDAGKQFGAVTLMTLARMWDGNYE